jgi:putative membrane-bound dehydrogenase-like protein
MKQWTGLVLFLAGVGLARAADRTLHEWDRVVLEDRFFSEGAHVGDFNNDGKMDVVSGPYWYAGPEFKTRHEIYEPIPFDKNTYSKNFLCYGDDVDRDGWCDVVIIGFPGEASWWMRNSKDPNKRWDRFEIDNYVGNESPAYEDIDGDGRKDAIYISERGQYGYATPDPADPTKRWKFVGISPVSNLHRFTHGMGVGDVNDDGRLDIIEKDGWWEHPVAGTKGLWKQHKVAFAGPGGGQMFAYDVDGDGDNDIITSLQAHAYGLAWYEQTKKDGGEVVYKKHVILNEKPEPNEYGIVFSQLHSLDLVDIDGDGIKDVVTGKRHWAHNGNDPDERGPAVLYWFGIVRGKDGVEFVPHLIDNSSGVGTQVLASDITGDGLPDIVVGNKLGTYLNIHKTRKVSEQEWEAAQPKKQGPAKAEADPKNDSKTDLKNDRLSGNFPKNAKGRELNLGFETGTLADWKVVSGTAFVRQPVEGDRVSARRSDMKSAHAGKYWLGSFEALGDVPQGILVSKPFLVNQPFASFLVGGGAETITRVELVDPTNDRVFFKISGSNSEDMRPVLVDLAAWQGKEIFVRIIDRASGGWGHINFDDFRFHATKPTLVDEIAPAKADEFAFGGLPAEQAVRVMTAPEGFRVDLIAAEPDIVQPIAMTIDERGRLWVVESHEYPVRAPEGKGRDRVLIFADADGDGRFETKKVFAEGLNLVSGIEVGFGGVYIGAAPYLYFIPDADRDDKPDAPPEILLDGWAYQDTHETLNSFIWGPDGWLYGCHGVFTHSRVGRPGTAEKDRQPINAGIWRFHPQRKVFEVFAHGTSNPWGVDFNDQGQCFLVCCVIPHLYHVAQGARYFRQAGTHFNPFTFDDIPTIAKHRHWVGPQPHLGNSYSGSAGGGHAHSGCMIYLGGSWPDKYRNQIFMNNIHGARLNQDKLDAKGSGYVGDRAPDFLLTNDQASQIVYFRSGPDGQCYMIDWYDLNQCHRVDRNSHDESNGRVLRLAYQDAKSAKVDLSKASDEELVRYQLDANDWYVRTARRILQERFALKSLQAKTRESLRKIAIEHADETRRLRGAWSLHVTGGIDEESLGRLLRDDSPYVRGFAIQLGLESAADDPSSTFLAEMIRLAKEDPSPVVRLYLTSAAMRTSPDSRTLLLSYLNAHEEDKDDHNLPLMLWYAMEPLAENDPAAALALATRSVHPIHPEYMARRIVLSEGKEGLGFVVSALRAEGSTPTTVQALVQGLSAALEGQRRVAAPEGWTAVAIKLMRSVDSRTADQVRSLSAKFGDSAEVAVLKELVQDQGADLSKRREALRTLLEVKEPSLVDLLYGQLSPSPLRAMAIRGLASYSDGRTPERLLNIWPDLSLPERRDAVATLASRSEYASKLLEGVADKKIPPSELGADIIRQLRSLGSKEITQRVEEVWGIARDVSENKAAEIAKYKSLLTKDRSAPVDVTLGRAVFAKTCATCHELFGIGSDVGPGLTGSNRRDLEYVLHNVLDPSSVMAREYQPYTAVTVDGRVLTGIIRERNENRVAIRTANELVVLPASEIEEMTLSPKSMMPEDQLSHLSEEETRALVAYLASPEQVPLRATADTASLIFNGQDLSYWHGEKKYWSVENGELVGRSPGLSHNAFLVSDLVVNDFRLRVQVKLTPNKGNSGIQFRSAELPGGEMKGYQADIGAGWWGKLYEENGRGLLWDKSGESAVKLNDWNEYEIVAQQGRIKTFINGQPSVDLKDDKGDAQGYLALQIHAGPAMEVRFKNFRLEVDPSIESAGSP